MIFDPLCVLVFLNKRDNIDLNSFPIYLNRIEYLCQTLLLFMIFRYLHYLEHHLN